MIENILVKQQVSWALDKCELINKIDPLWLMDALQIWEVEHNCTHDSDELPEWYCNLDYSKCFKAKYNTNSIDNNDDVFASVSGLLMDIVGVDY